MESVVALRSGSGVPVSYTHLDVYKRQTFFAALPAADPTPFIALAAPASVTIGSVSESSTANTAAAIDATPKAQAAEYYLSLIHI